MPLTEHKPKAASGADGVKADVIPAASGLQADIVFGFLSWNTRHCIVEDWLSVLAEADRCEQRGLRAYAIAVDNGSNDGSGEALFACQTAKSSVILNERNEGSSRARNQIIEHALQLGAKHLVMLDGDIEMIPGSTLGLINVLERHGSQTYCAGMKSYGQAKTRNGISREWRENQPLLWDWMDCAMTQYGVYRMQPFRDGVRFVDDYGIGWGWEDNDLHMEMKQRGMRCAVVDGHVYLHRALHSSWDAMRAQGVNLAREYNRRKDLFLRRWGHIRSPFIEQARRAVFTAA